MNTIAPDDPIDAIVPRNPGSPIVPLMAAEIAMTIVAVNIPVDTTIRFFAVPLRVRRRSRCPVGVGSSST